MMRRVILMGAAAAFLVTLAPQPRCFASTLPRPAARFLHYFQKAEPVETSTGSIWERFVVSLIWATSAPEPSKDTPAKS